ncbi:hypothetical protein C5167_016344 [Papaver somniferum]|nr:hypothetical protein C5167_016344 [Papaver somniferum]
MGMDCFNGLMGPMLEVVLDIQKKRNIEQEKGKEMEDENATMQEQSTVPSLRKALRDVAMEKDVTIVARGSFNPVTVGQETPKRGRRKTIQSKQFIYMIC